jgi:hypothetical protein
MSNKTTFDASIPVLTEVFQDKNVGQEQAGGKTAAAAVAPTASASAPAPADEASLEARALSQWSAPEWELLERRLSERILHQLQGRVDFVLEQRVRDSVEEALQHAIAGLTNEIRQSVQHTIEQIVVRAVTQEIAHLQTLKR